MTERLVIDYASIPGYPGYFADVLGQIWSDRKAGVRRLLHPSTTPKGYLRLTVYDGIQKVTRSVHSLVLTAFSGPRLAGMESRHLNGDPADNRLQNLRWGTAQENYRDRVTHGTDDNLRRRAASHCRRGHEYTDENVYWFDGRRYCRTCHKINARAWTRKRSNG